MPAGRGDRLHVYQWWCRRGLSAQYALLPGVLHAYKVSAADLGNYVAPVPLPPALLMMLPGLALLAARQRRKPV